ncbi:hypothetical protein Tco_0284238, partial [Tanacetum coccineum]
HVAFPYLLQEESDKHRKTVGIEIGRNRKNENYNTLGSSADIGKSYEVPHSFHNKDIVVEEFVNHEGNNQNFDCSTGPEQMMDKDIYNEHHSHMIRKNTSGTRAVESCRNNSDKDNIVDKLRP